MWVCHAVSRRMETELVWRSYLFEATIINIIFKQINWLVDIYSGKIIYQYSVFFFWYVLLFRTFYYPNNLRYNSHSEQTDRSV